MEQPYVPNEFRETVQNLCHQTLNLVVNTRHRSVVDEICYGDLDVDYHRTNRFNHILRVLNDVLSRPIRQKSDYQGAADRLRWVQLTLVDIMFPDNQSADETQRVISNMVQGA